MKTRPGITVYALRVALVTAGAVAVASGARGQGDAAREVVDRTRTKVVILKTARSNTRGAACGFLAGSGLVLTAQHAVEGVSSITAWVNGVSYAASVLSTHPDYDLALLRLTAPNLLLKPVELGRTTEGLAAGEPLVILAGPSQPPAAVGEPTERVPIPAHYRRRIPLRDAAGRQGVMLALDASVERGDSGSPVLRPKDGTVVGVLSSRELPDADGISHSAYAVPIEAVHSWLEAATRRGRGDEEFYLFRAAPQKGG